MNELAVVLISKNQAWNMSRLIESVLEETSWIGSKEILLVDSASTDETIKVAKKHSIKIIHLLPNQHLAPAVGRYIGEKHSNSKFILFLDGDMELFPGWLKKGCEFLKNRPEVAVVTGKRIDLPTTEKHKNDSVINSDTHGDATEISYSGGAAMYRRSVLNDVGTFNPYLFSDEEPDLCIRIRNAGYKILQLQLPIVYHYTDPVDSLISKTKRWKRNLYLGAGQNLRYHFGTKNFWPYVKERGYGIVPVLGTLLGFSLLFWYFMSGQIFPFKLWCSGLVLFLIVDAIRKRSIYMTVVSLLERFFIADGTVRGFFKKPTDPNKYNAKYEIIE